MTDKNNSKPPPHVILLNLIETLLGKPRGFGFVIMTDQESMQKVIDASPHYLEGKLVSRELN